jgi:hypothetical protein
VQTERRTLDQIERLNPTGHEDYYNGKLRLPLDEDVTQ